LPAHEASLFWKGKEKDDKGRFFLVFVAWEVKMSEDSEVAVAEWPQRLVDSFV